eukprot:gene27675-34433_t
MFISGASGTGKSFLLKILAQGIKALYSEVSQESKYGAVLATATTIGGANRIKGHLWKTALSASFGVSTHLLSPKEERYLRSNFGGLKVMLIDDISLLSLESLSDIDRRLCVAKQEFGKPFGGVHIIMSGDLFQFRPIAGTSVVERSIPEENLAAVRGRVLFDELTHFVRLTVNHRSGIFQPLPIFLRQARLGTVSRADLDVVNCQVVCGLESALSVVHPKSIYITATHARANAINAACLKHLQDKGRETTRLVATHRPTRLADHYPLDSDTRRALAEFRQTAFLAPPVIEVCVGSRVRLTSSIAPSLGLYAGVMGTVCGFLYSGDEPSRAGITPPTAECDTEQPIVLLRLDDDDDDDVLPFSCSVDVPRLIPIVPSRSRETLSLGGKKYYRLQYPFSPAHGRTMIGMIGLSPIYPIVVDEMLTTLGSESSVNFAFTYAAMSVARSLGSLCLLEPLTHAHFADSPEHRNQIHQEYTRLSILYHSGRYERHDLIEKRLSDKQRSDALMSSEKRVIDAVNGGAYHIMKLEKRQTSSGGVEYVPKYASQTETAECKLMLNLAGRKLGEALKSLEE